MTSIGRNAFRVAFKFDGELTNERVKESLSETFVLPVGDFDYLHMLDTLMQENDFKNHVLECLDDAIEEENTGTYEQQIASYIDIINSQYTLAEFKKCPYYRIAVVDLAAVLRYAGHSTVKPADLFKIQPGFRESKFETTVGYNDPRLCHLFLSSVADSLP